MIFLMRLLKAVLDDYINVGVVEMEEESEFSFNNVPNELIHRIQSLLPAKDAARTCVLSNSWLHAWSTLPALRFTKCVTHDNLTEQEQMDYIQLIDLTLVRYLNHNLSIECFHLHLDIHNSSLPFPLQNWFQALAAASTNYSSLKDLSLTTYYMKHYNHFSDDVWLTLPDAIFSCRNLYTLSFKAESIGAIGLVRVNSNPPIKCSLLRVLNLKDVCITQGTLDNLLSSCTLLEKIHIDFHFIVNWNKNKVENLPFLCELILTSFDHNVLEIFNLPSLHLLSYRSLLSTYTTIKMNTLGSVRELVLSQLPIVDDSFSELIKSKFPFLEILNLSINKCVLRTIHLTCPSLKRFTLDMFLNKQINIQVYASDLLFFYYDGLKMPTLLFPSSTPAHIKLILRLHKHLPIDLFYILKVREALDLSTNFDIETRDGFVPSNIDLDDLRRLVPLPARNVQQLSFGKNCKPRSWNHMPVLDLLFSICYPRYIKASYRSPGSKNYWYNQMVRIMEKKMCDLKDVEIKSPRDGKWESLTISRFELPWRSFYDEGNHYISDETNIYDSDEYKLHWLS